MSLFIGLFLKNLVFTIKVIKAFTATLFFILQSVFIYNRLMSTKKQVSSFCKPYSVYDERPEQFLDKTDIDSHFHNNFLDISQAQNRIVRVSKGSNKQSSTFKVFLFSDSKLQQRFILKEEVSISEKEILYSTVWVIFSKLLIKPTKYRKFHYQNLNLRLDLQRQKSN